MKLFDRTVVLHQPGIPEVLNASFRENEPIVSIPVDALDCYLRTMLNQLVMVVVVLVRVSF